MIGGEAMPEQLAERNKKISESVTGFKHSDEAKQKITEALKLRVRKVAPVTQLDMYGDVIKTFESAKLASAEVFESPDRIRECCRGVRESHKGFKWKYSEQKAQ